MKSAHILAVVSLVVVSCGPNTSASEAACSIYYDFPSDPGQAQVQELATASAGAEAPGIRAVAEGLDQTAEAFRTLDEVELLDLSLQDDLAKLGDACADLGLSTEEALAKMCDRLVIWLEDEDGRTEDLALLIHNAAFLSGDDEAIDTAEFWLQAHKDENRENAGEGLTRLIERCEDKGHHEPRREFNELLED